MRKALTVSAICASLIALTSTPAMAGLGPGRGTAEATEGPDRTYGAKVTIKYTSSGKGGNGSGPVTSVDPNWTPPACWYAPEWKATEFRDWRQRLNYIAVHDPGAGDARTEISDENENYARGDYDNFNIDKEKEGMWWGAQQNPDAPLDEQMKCDRDPFWVKNGEIPEDVPEVIKPETLAGLAYNQIQVPGTKVSLAPGGASKVNLPTWAWLDKGEFKPVSVTASLDAPGLHIEATTTATPVSLTIKPGTDDAKLLPGSGTCEINDDGSIGEPYAKGKAKQTPPCGVVYQRSSGDGTYDLQATATWEITWEGTGGAKGTLPNGEYGNDQAVKVEEIQSVNR